MKHFVARNLVEIERVVDRLFWGFLIILCTAMLATAAYIQHTTP